MQIEMTKGDIRVTVTMRYRQRMLYRLIRSNLWR